VWRDPEEVLWRPMIYHFGPLLGGTSDSSAVF